MGPHQAMAVAERLYLNGWVKGTKGASTADCRPSRLLSPTQPHRNSYLSYPRTESTAYPDSFDVRGALALQAGNPIWGDYVK